MYFAIAPNLLICMRLCIVTCEFTPLPSITLRESLSLTAILKAGEARRTKIIYHWIQI